MQPQTPSLDYDRTVGSEWRWSRDDVRVMQLFYGELLGRRIRRRSMAM